MMQDQAADLDTHEKPIHRLARIIHTGLAPLFMRFGLNYAEQKHILGWSMVNAALNESEFVIQGRNVHKQTLSHAAILTGMTRREVSALADLATPDTSNISARTQRVARILSAWLEQDGYQDAGGQPLVLPIRGPFPSFETLARHESRDTPARAMADILVTDGYARWEGKKLRLMTSVKTAPACSDDEIHLLTQITQDFLDTINTILDPTSTDRPRIRSSNCHAISTVSFKELRDRLHEEMAEFNARCNTIMEEYRAPAGETTIRVGVSSFSCFERDARAPAEKNLRIVKN